MDVSLIFAYALRSLSLSTPQVLDVAGGKGELACALAALGVPATLLEPCPRPRNTPLPTLVAVVVAALTGDGAALLGEAPQLLDGERPPPVCGQSDGGSEAKALRTADLVRCVCCGGMVSFIVVFVVWPFGDGGVAMPGVVDFFTESRWWHDPLYRSTANLFTLISSQHPITHSGAALLGRGGDARRRRDRAHRGARAPAAGAVCGGAVLRRRQALSVSRAAPQCKSCLWCSFGVCVVLVV